MRRSLRIRYGGFTTCGASRTEFTNPDGSPALLANTLLETNFQLSSSCITCHNTASRGSASQGRLAFFQTSASGTAGYVGAMESPSNKYVDASGNPVCYDSGPSRVFTDCKAADPAVVYKTLDYVWLLREAQ